MDLCVNVKAQIQSSRGLNKAFIGLLHQFYRTEFLILNSNMNFSESPSEQDPVELPNVP